jgi:hypothetical protein
MDQQPMTQMPEAPVKPTNPLSTYFRQPKVYLKLPSKGRFYSAGSLDKSGIDEYPVYAMTAKDELMFKTPDALMNGSATVEVIRSCVPAIQDPWNMPSIDIDAVLIAIRIATYGENMELAVECPSCDHLNDYIIDLLRYLDKASNFDFVSSIAIGPLTVNIRPYSYREITKTALKTIEQNRIIDIVNNDNLSDEEKIEQFGKSFVKLTSMTVEVIAGCIESIDTPDGRVEDQTMILEFINNSSSEVFNTINDHIVLMKEKIALGAHDAECKECGHKFSVEITMDQTNFFAKGSHRSLEKRS